MTIDRTDANDLLASTESNRRDLNLNGNNEQWKRHLEKAYFERQAEAMKMKESETAAQAEQYSTSDKVRSMDELIELRDVSANVPPQIPFDRQVDTNLSSTRTNTLVSGTALNIPTKISDQLLGGASAYNTRISTAGPNNANSAPEMSKTHSPHWKTELPATSLVTAITTDEGVHLVIRDNQLAASDIRQIVDRLRRLMREDGKFLSALTLNGERLWTASTVEQN